MYRTEFEEKLRAAVLSRTLEAFSMMISRNSKNMRKKNTQSYYHYLVCPASIETVERKLDSLLER